MNRRRCTSCKTYKPLDLFPSNPAYPDGKGRVCRFCKEMQWAKWKWIHRHRRPVPIAPALPPE